MMMNWCCSDFMMIWIWIRNFQWLMIVIVIYLPVLRRFIVAVVMLVVVWVTGLLGVTKPGSVV